MHEALKSTLADPHALFSEKLRMMACHETPPGAELPCVGWLHHQIGAGNNVMLRLAVVTGKVDGKYMLDGPQHACFEDTLP